MSHSGGWIAQGAIIGGYCALYGLYTGIQAPAWIPNLESSCFLSNKESWSFQDSVTKLELGNQSDQSETGGVHIRNRAIAVLRRMLAATSHWRQSTLD